jgi:DNA polymerase V
MNPLVIRREFSVTQEQLVRELNGEHCLDITGVPAPRKNIQVSRSFHDATDNYQTLSEAVSTFAAKACEKARAEGTVASAVYVHLNTSRFLGGYISEGLAHGFDIPTSHTPTVIRAALRLCRNLYRPNQFYKKASVMLLDLRDAAAVKSQGLLFRFTDQTPEEQERENRLMESIDQINRVLGKDTLFFGSQGTQRGWHGASEHRSPGYTVNWKEIPVVRAK